MNLNPHGVDVDTVQPGDTVTFKGVMGERLGIMGRTAKVHFASGNTTAIALEDITSIERTPIPIELGQYWSGRRIDLTADVCDVQTSLVDMPKSSIEEYERMPLDEFNVSFEYWHGTIKEWRAETGPLLPVTADRQKIHEAILVARGSVQ